MAVEDFGIIISKEGFDYTDTDDKNILLKSDLTLLKVFDSGTKSLTGSVGDFTTVAHSLGYVPQFLVYVKDTTPTPDAIYLATADLGVAVARADTSNIYIQKGNANQAEAYYYIFYEPANTGTAPSVVSTNDYGIMVTKAGKDIATANILEQTFNSEKNSLKIVTEDETTSTANGARTVTIAHGLSVIPAYFVFYEVANNGNWFSNFTEAHDTGAIVEARADATNLKIDITTTSSQEVKVRYYILADPGN